MATSGINQLNKLRLMGMSSGMDTESIITQMMKIEQLKVDKQFQTKARYEYKKEAYQDVNKQILAFRREFLNSSTGILNRNNIKAFKVTSDDKNNAIGITAGTTALTGSNKVNAVAQLAKAASMASTGKVSVGGTGITSTATKLKDLNLGTKIVGEGHVDAVEPDEFGQGGVEGVVGTIKFTINGKEFNFTEDDTLQTVINTVNADKDANVTMTYSQLTDGISITSKTTGKDSTLTAGDDANGGNFLAAMNISGPATAGQNAILFINGTRTEQTKNQFSIDGISYDLKKTFGAISDGAGDFTIDPAAEGVTFQISADVDKTMDVIKGFIEGYNKLVVSLTSLTTTRPDKAYPPLTDEQRDSLSETQQDKWDKIAKQGMLYNDSGLNKILEDLRGAFFSKVEGTGMSLNDLGIGPGASVIDGKYVGTQQEIVIKDEDKLRAMIEQNPDLVSRVFTQIPTSKEGSARYNEAGIGNKLTQLMTAYESKVKDTTFSGLDRYIKDANNLMTTLKDRMSAKEELLYKKFAAMETAMSKLQSQGNWFASQMGG